ncbi:MAG TPA: hypothetical protein VKY73_08040 [Polyangiaceae bacterium]|nr:hypothetical protein [Polyangiaceae bacterium]
MTKRTRLLAAPLLSFLAVLVPAACASSNPEGPGGNSTGGASPTGGAAGSVGTGTSSGGANTGASGSPAVGGSPATGGTSPTGGSAGTTGGSVGSGGTSGGSAGEAGGSAGTPPGGASGPLGGAAGGGGTSGGAGGTSGGDGGSPPSETGGAGSANDPGTPVECDLPDLPDSSALTYENQKLPDPFTFFDGRKVTTKAEWECRRKEILAMADKYLYGPVPPTPDEVTGTVNGGNVSITVTVGSKTEDFTATIGNGSGDVIALELSGGIFPQGRKKLSFGSGFEGKIRNLFGYSQLNPNVANGWMVDRVIDVLEQNPDSGHDPKKMMVSGCSGCGKGAFLVGVFSRIPLTVIVESGGGGASNLRMTEWFRHGAGGNIYQCADAKPQGIDNLEDNGICGPWVTNAASWLRQNPAKVYNLPFDQHLLLATIAPRYLVHFTNDHGVNSWCHLGGTGEALSAWAAEPVWNALGVPERMGFLQYSAGHCSTPSAATSLANEFFKRAFQGDQNAKTDVMEIMANGVQQPVSEWKSMWVDWDMETTLQ